MLNTVEIVEVESGLMLEIEKIELETGQSMEIIDEMINVELEKLSLELKEKDVGIPFGERAKKIIDDRHHAMIDLYLGEHPGESAIFWSGNTEAAERAHEYFKKPRPGIPCALVHSKIDEDAIDQVRDFRAGKIKVVFCVQMMQEGFDMASLAWGYDCRFLRSLSQIRVARIVKRLGRLIRKQGGKPVSRYYIALDLTHYYTDNIPSESLMVPALVTIGEALNLLDAEQEVEFLPSETKTIAGERWTWTVCETAQCQIASVDGFQVRDRALVRDVFERVAHDTVRRNKARLLRMAKAGERRPQFGDAHYNRFRAYMMGDPVFRAAILAANPKWAVRRVIRTERQIQASVAERETPARTDAPKPEKKLWVIVHHWMPKRPDINERLTDASGEGWKIGSDITMDRTYTGLKAEVLADMRAHDKRHCDRCGELAAS